ncbi:hypothetical protein PsorP6_012233 [Peronosclerospora sorghi]|uniref:Uncharacterized protein n=1 Tax=Peronosclerospora sorghi TaxID=230839 RepID=A0ACC0WM60_9STRA|nr:hypothetical protein PsorP6_012233 [Peronosclerospora sorghi]
MHKASGSPRKCATKQPNVAYQCQFCVRLDFYYLLLKGCVNLGSIPDRSDWFFDMTPVDYSARAIVHFAASLPVEALGITLHIQNPSLPVKSDDFFSYFTTPIASKKLATTDFTEWKRSMLQGATIETAPLELKNWRRVLTRSKFICGATRCLTQRFHRSCSKPLASPTQVLTRNYW